MHLIDTTGSVNNQFSDGNPLTGQPATVVDAAFLNALMNEIAYVIEEAGITLEKGVNTQLRAAIASMIAGGGPAVTAAGVSVADAANLFNAPDNVENALAQLALTLLNQTYTASRIRRNVVALNGAAHNAASGHFENVVEVNHNAAATYTVLSDVNLSSPIGTTITIFQAGSGQVALAAEGGVTLHVHSAFQAKTLGQHAPLVLTKTAANTWRVGGTLAAV